DAFARILRDRGLLLLGHRGRRGREQEGSADDEHRAASSGPENASYHARFLIQGEQNRSAVGKTVLCSQLSTSATRPVVCDFARRLYRRVAPCSAPDRLTLCGSVSPLPHFAVVRHPSQAAPLAQLFNLH